MANPTGPSSERQYPAVSQANKYRLKSNQNWFPFNRLYTRIMSKLDALFIQDVINIGSMSERVDDQGWFPCPNSRLEKDWSEREITYHLGSLKEPVKGFGLGEGGAERSLIQIDRRGVPGKRWVRVDLDLIDAMIAAYLNGEFPVTTKTSELVPPISTSDKNVGTTTAENGVTPKRVCIKEPSSITVAASRTTDGSEQKPNRRPKAERSERVGTGKPPAKSPTACDTGKTPAQTTETPTDLLGTPTAPPKQETTLANRLRQILIERGVVVTKWSERGWALHMRRMIAVDRIDPARLVAVMEWFAANAALQYMPTVESADSFRSKFPKLAARMEQECRQNPDSGPTPSNSVKPSSVSPLKPSFEFKFNIDREDGWIPALQKGAPAIVDRYCLESDAKDARDSFYRFRQAVIGMKQLSAEGAKLRKAVIDLTSSFQWAEEHLFGWFRDFLTHRAAEPGWDGSLEGSRWKPWRKEAIRRFRAPLDHHLFDENWQELIDALEPDWDRPQPGQRGWKPYVAPKEKSRD